jgi:hypothetical protein
MLRTAVDLKNGFDAIQAITENSCCMSWAEFVELYGEEGVLRFIRGVLFENAQTTPALCSEGCETLPGVRCIHGCPSLFDSLVTRALSPRVSAPSLRLVRNRSAMQTSSDAA